jgi:ubiquinone/menaquinone biosynthesis C-methylase UbiE
MNTTAKAIKSASETERVRQIYDQVANNYDPFLDVAEQLFPSEGRRWVCSQARGAVLEIAVGTGRNVPFYPEHVQLTGIDLSPAMLTRARQRGLELGRQVNLGIGDAQALPFPDESFDSVVFTLALCSIPDDRRAIVEAKRVLRPGGRLLLLEHVRSPIWPVQALQRLFAPPVYRWLADHLLREPLDHVKAEGFKIDRVERSAWGLIERLAACKPGQTLTR